MSSSVNGRNGDNGVSAPGKEECSNNNAVKNWLIKVEDGSELSSPAASSGIIHLSETAALAHQIAGHDRIGRCFKTKWLR